MDRYIELALEYLKNQNEPKTTREIINNIEETLRKENYSGNLYNTLSGHISSEVKKEGSDLVTMDFNRPKKFWLKSKIDNYDDRCSVINGNESMKQVDISEEDFYPIFNDVMQKYLIHSFRINEKVTENDQKGLNEWINPDIVGVKYYFEDPTYESEVYELMKNENSKLFVSYSFELKKEITLSELKKNYFQTVSNSSWAHQGFLVCYKINEHNEQLMAELERLNHAFGIGLIKVDIDTNDINDSDMRIIYDARFNENLDYESISNLSSKNWQFRKYIESIRASIQSGKYVVVQ